MALRKDDTHKSRSVPSFLHLTSLPRLDVCVCVKNRPSDGLVLPVLRH